jgi:hypothetical protein
MSKFSQVRLLTLSVAVVIVSLAGSTAAQAPQKAGLAGQGNTAVTLFAVNKYHQQKSGCLSLGALPDCQLRYGSL